MTDILTLLWWLIVAHVLADWCWQSSFIAENKGRVRLVMLVHCLAWAGVVCVPLVLFDCFAPWKVGFLFCLHWVCDGLKCGMMAKKKPVDARRTWRWIWYDQAFHLLQLIVVGVY